jgi:MFS family permease
MMNPWSGLKQLPRDAWILCAASFVNRAGTMVLPFLAIYLTKNQGFSTGRAGFVVALYGVGALLTAPLSGWLSDRLGAVLIMRISVFFSAVVLFLFPWASGFPSICVMTLLFAITAEMFRPSSMAFITMLVTPEQRKPAFALARLAVNLGMSVGPAVAGLLATVSYVWLFLIDGITSFLSGIVLLLFLTNVPRGRQIKAKQLSSPAGTRAFSDSRFLYFLVATILISIVFFQHISAMPLFMIRDLHLSEAAYGFMFTINTLLIVLIEVPLNLKTVHWSHRKSQCLGALLFSIGFGSFAFVSGFWGVLTSVVIWTLGEMILFPAMSSFVAHLAPPNRQGEYMGLYTMAFAFAFAIGPWAGAAVLERYGAIVLWLSAFVLGCIASLLLANVREERISVSGATESIA